MKGKLRSFFPVFYFLFFFEKKICFSYFLPQISPIYGACYTFNTELNLKDDYRRYRRSSMTGPFFGLSLVLNLEQKEYLKGGITKQVPHVPYNLPNSILHN